MILLPRTVRLKLLVLLPAWLLATQLYRPSSERVTSGSWSRVSCPSNNRFLCKDSGCPSFIQVRVGRGNPRASQVKVTRDPWTTVTGSTGSTWSTPGGTADQEHILINSTDVHWFVSSLKKVEYEMFGFYLGLAHHSWAQRRLLDSVPRMCKLQSQIVAQEQSFI